MNHVQPIPEVISGETENKTTEEKKNFVCSSESGDVTKNLTSHCGNGLSSEIPNVEQGSEHSSGNFNGKRKDKSKRTVNGLIKSAASPERVSKDFKDTSETCPEPKKVKVENENSMQDRDVEDLLSDNTVAKIPNEPLQTLGTATTMETVSASSSEDTKLDLVSDSAASSSAQCSDDSEKTNEPVENSPRRDTTENTCEHNSTEKDSKPEKKNSEQHHRKHKKRKEKKRHRHTSGNDSTGSDAPGSPVYNQSQGVFSSPRRPRMSFDVDLGKTSTNVKISHINVKNRNLKLSFSLHFCLLRTQIQFLLVSVKSSRTRLCDYVYQQKSHYDFLQVYMGFFHEGEHSLASLNSF